MTKTFIITGILAGALTIVGCGDKEGNSDDSNASTSSPTTTAGPTSDSEGTGDNTDTNGTATTNPTGGSETDGTTDDPSTGPTTDDPTTTSETDDGTMFIETPDIPVVQDCSTYEEDCDDGQKCMPWANDGGSSWNALKCVDVTGEGLAGDPCLVEGSGVSGNDNCDLHHMCWDVDPETLEGTCVAFCDGNSEAPTCEDLNTTCIIANEGVLNLCLPVCDALVQDCPDGQACYPINDSFTCAPVAVAEDTGLDGDPCEYVNACQAGNMCASADSLVDCNMTNFCCTPMCDLEEANMCGNGEECIPIFDPMVNMTNVGQCGVPA